MEVCLMEKIINKSAAKAITGFFLISVKDKVPM
jgi:hypothetical protein